MVNYGHNMGSLKNSTFFTRFLASEFEKIRGPSLFPRVLKAWSPDHPTQSEAFIFFAINCKFERDQFIKMWNGVQVNGFLIKADKEKELETSKMQIKALEEQLAKYKCCVCLDFYHAGDVGGLTCGHVGHKECLSAAVTISKKCPKCRKPHPTVVVLDEGERMEVEITDILI